MNKGESHRMHSFSPGGRARVLSLSTTEIPSCCCMLLADSFSLLSGISVGVYCIWLPIHLFMRNLVVFSFGLL